MINPLAGTFMTATLNRQNAFWESSSFNNHPTVVPPPRLVAAPRHGGRRRGPGLFRRLFTPAVSAT